MYRFDKLAILSILVLPIMSISAAAEQPGELAAAMRQAKSKAEMDQIVDRFVQEQIYAVDRLSTLLQEAKDPEVKVRACFLLGEIGNGRAMRVLVDNLLVKAEVPREERRGLWGPYPCQDALVKIGKPVELSLIEIFSEPVGDPTKEALLHVLQTIEGWRGAVFVLEEARERAGPDERKNLDKVLEQARKELGPQREVYLLRPCAGEQAKPQ